MDKFKSAHELKRNWTVVQGIKRQRPKNFQKKLKKILQEAQTAPTNDTAVSSKKQNVLPYHISLKKLHSVKNIEVTDKSETVSKKKKVSKRKQTTTFLKTGNVEVYQEDTSNTECKLKSPTVQKISIFPDNECGESVVRRKSNLADKQRKKKKSVCRSEVKNLNSKSNDNMSIDNIDNMKVSDKSVQHLKLARANQNNLIGNEKKTVDENNQIKGDGKRKRKHSNVSDKVNKIDGSQNEQLLVNKQNIELCQTPLVIEVEPNDNRSKTPLMLLEKLTSDKEDDMEVALREFYSSLESTEISTTAEVDCNTEMKHLFESDHEKSEMEYFSENDVNENITNYKSYAEHLFESEVSENSSAYYRSDMKSGSEVCDNYKDQEIEEGLHLSVVVHKLPHREQYLLLMKHPYTVFFKGNLTISVLLGSIEILGCFMSTDRNSHHTVYSPKGSSMLSIDTCLSAPPSSIDYEVMNENLVELGLELSKDIIADVEQRDCVLLLEAPPPSSLEGYLKTLPPHLQLFTFTHKEKWNDKEREANPLYEAEKGLKCVFEFPNTIWRLKRFMKGPEWNALTDTIIREPGCTMLCGGKGVGKSTFLRYLINQCLPVYGEVLCLDFDPGQAEFTVPGCVSAVIVKQPLLGPNFTHLTTPECMVYIGEVNIGQCPAQYVDSVQYIINFCNSKHELKRMPWIVNTMGFSKGVGVDLTVSIIHMLKPHRVIQIESSKKNINFPELLHSSYVHQYQSRFYKGPWGPLNYALHNIQTMAEDKEINSPWGMGAAQLREAMVLSYLSQMTHPPNYSLTNIAPYITPFSKVTLCICHSKLPFSQILSAMNGNLVALCSYHGNDTLIPNDPNLPSVLRCQPICPCIGFGVVRGIDMEEKRLFLITPVPEALMTRVNCLMMGTVMLPDCVYIMATGCEGQIPYVATGPGQPTSMVARRFFRPLEFVHGKKENVKQ